MVNSRAIRLMMEQITCVGRMARRKKERP